MANSLRDPAAREGDSLSAGRKHSGARRTPPAAPEQTEASKQAAPGRAKPEQAPAPESEHHSDTIPAPAWFDEVTD